MKDWDFRGLAVLAIAACAAVGIFIITPLALIWGIKFGDGKVLVGLGGALIGAVAAYIGMKLTGNGGPQP